MALARRRLFSSTAENPSVIGCADATSPFVLRKNGEDRRR